MNMKLHYYLYMILSITLLTGFKTESRPQNISQSDPIEELIHQGRMQMLAFKLPLAERTFQQVIRNNKGALQNAKGHYYLSMISLWKASFEGSEASFERFYAQNRQFSDELRFVQDIKWRRFFMGEAAFQKIIILAQQQKLMDAALSAKDAYNLFKRNIEEFPDFYESYKGMGILRVAVGSLPRGYRNILNILGYSGSIKQGMADIELAAAKSEFIREEAQVYWAFIDQNLNDSLANSNNIDRIKMVYEENKESPFFSLVYGYMLMNKQQADEAERVLLSNQSKQNNPEYYFPVTYHFYLGNIYFRQNRMKDAEEQFKRYLTEFKGSFMKAEASLKLGLSLELQGRRNEALPYFQSIQSVSAFDSDENARRQALIHIASALDSTATKLLYAQNSYDAGHFDKALEVVVPLTTQEGLSNSYKAEAFYRTGRVLEWKQEYAKAIEYYQKSVDTPNDVLAKWGPWSLYYIGECYEMMGDKNNAREAYRKTLANKEKFDYYQSLEQKSRTALERLRL
jgi:tetratricopeptide (TPR) repeat protein